MRYQSSNRACGARSFCQPIKVKKHNIINIKVSLDFRSEVFKFRLKK